MTDLVRLGRVKGVGNVYQSAKSADEQLREFREHGLVYPSVADACGIRLAGLSLDGTRTSVMPIVVKGKSTILVRDSLLFLSPALTSYAVDCYRAGKYPQQPTQVYDFFEAEAKAQDGLEPEDRNSIILSQQGDFSITAETLEALFLKISQRYFDEVNGKRPIIIRNLSGQSTDSATVGYTWFDRPDFGSGLDLWDRYLYNDVRAFGLLRSRGATEPTQKIIVFQILELQVQLQFKKFLQEKICLVLKQLFLVQSQTELLQT